MEAWKSLARTAPMVVLFGLLLMAGPIDSAAVSRPMTQQQQAAPEPIVEFRYWPKDATEDAPGLPPEVLINETFTFDILFRNSGGVGYGPYIDLYLPFEGADDFTSSVDCDGISFVSADYAGFGPLNLLSAPVLVQISGNSPVCPVLARTDHPLTNAPFGPALEGYLLVIIEIPHGSYYAQQPPARITVTASTHRYADVGHALQVRAAGGFRYGGDPTGTQPPISGTPQAVDDVIPSLFTITKEYLSPEDETATGPNYERTYRLIVNIATGATVSNLEVIDRFPNNLAYTGPGAMSPGCSVTLAPPAGVASNGPPLKVNCGTQTGTTSDADVTVEVEFFAPLRDANGNGVLDPRSCSAQAINDVAIEGDWTPWDPRDAAARVVSDPQPEDHELQLLCIGLVKTGYNVDEGC